VEAPRVERPPSVPFPSDRRHPSGIVIGPPFSLEVVARPGPLVRDPPPVHWWRPSASGAGASRRTTSPGTWSPKISATCRSRSPNESAGAWVRPGGSQPGPRRFLLRPGPNRRLPP